MFGATLAAPAAGAPRDGSGGEEEELKVVEDDEGDETGELADTAARDEEVTVRGEVLPLGAEEALEEAALEEEVLEEAVVKTTSSSRSKRF